MKAVAIMMLLVGTIIYSGAQTCAPGDDFCPYMQRIGEAVKVSFMKYSRLGLYQCLFVCQCCR